MPSVCHVKFSPLRILLPRRTALSGEESATLTEPTASKQSPLASQHPHSEIQLHRIPCDDDCPSHNLRVAGKTATIQHDELDNPARTVAVLNGPLSPAPESKYRQSLVHTIGLFRRCRFLMQHLILSDHQNLPLQVQVP
jgi:hypothetical protein